MEKTQAELDQMCKECGRCEFYRLADERDSAKLLFEWSLKIIKEVAKHYELKNGKSKVG